MLKNWRTAFCRRLLLDLNKWGHWCHTSTLPQWCHIESHDPDHISPCLCRFLVDRDWIVTRHSFYFQECSVIFVSECPFNRISWYFSQFMSGGLSCYALCNLDHATIVYKILFHVRLSMNCKLYKDHRYTQPCKSLILLVCDVNNHKDLRCQHCATSLIHLPCSSIRVEVVQPPLCKALGLST